MSLELGAVLGALGVLLSLASVVMKRMVPLRILAVAANVAFIGYGLHEWLMPTLVLNGALLPVNVYRLLEIRKLTREIAQARESSPVSEWLLPHMRRATFKRGQVLFRRGDAADRLIYLSRGELRLEEIGQPVRSGELVGEIGMFAPDRRRTQTLVCDSDGELYEMTGEMLFQLYYQHPRIGFELMKLVTERLMRDIQRASSPAAA
jgi:CRP/FNR family cyclic AMP-dependent transcriptional regulator